MMPDVIPKDSDYIRIYLTFNRRDQERVRSRYGSLFFDCNDSTGRHGEDFDN